MAEESSWGTPVIRLAISVEGPTEAEFVKKVLADHLRKSRIEPTPIILGRARSPSKSDGGNVSVERLASEMVYLLNSHDAVTSLVDFYGFCKKGRTTPEELQKRIDEEVDKKIGRSWDQTRVFSYVQQYEFEGLLFSDVSVFADLIHAPASAVEALRQIRSQFPTPEDINDNSDTAPSKRIPKVIPRYNKKVNGPLIAEKIGLGVIRTECPRFDAWVKRLESLGEPQHKEVKSNRRASHVE